MIILIHFSDFDRFHLGKDLMECEVCVNVHRLFKSLIRGEFSLNFRVLQAKGIHLLIVVSCLVS